MGIKTFILTHEDKATMNLFQMVKRYHENCPAFVKAEASRDNANELSFGQIDCSYALATAKTKGAGRSSTVQLLHGSEVAFWANAEDHIAGLFQAVPRIAGTEIILESTAYGQDNFFFKKWQQAMYGEDEYIAIFIPWFWEPSYRAISPTPLTLDDDEVILKELYQLDDLQLYWRRLKIKEGGDGKIGLSLFRREYPCNPVEAFDESIEDALFTADLINAARRTGTCARIGPKLLGADIGGMGKDFTSIIRRQGRVAYNLETHLHKDEAQIAGIIINIIKTEGIDKVLIDSIGLGSGVITILRHQGYKDYVIPVNGCSSPSKANADKYVNKRDEMYGELLEWLKDAPVEIPNDDLLAQDLLSVRYYFTSRGQRKLLDKGETSGRKLGRSPDRGDSLALTHAYEIGLRGEVNLPPVLQHLQSYGGEQWAT